MAVTATQVAFRDTGLDNGMKWMSAEKKNLRRKGLGKQSLEVRTQQGKLVPAWL